LLPQVSLGASSTVDGKTLAIEACSACHQVVPGQGKPPPVANPDEGSRIQAPSFVEIANRCQAAGDLQAKVANPHYPMRAQALSAGDAEAIARYIRSLAPATSCATRLK
jgi:hypothetical protein